jgi:hypothetical protein
MRYACAMSGSSTNRPPARQRAVRAAAALLLAVVLVACSDPMTLANYSKFRDDRNSVDTLEKVEAIFGAGTRIEGVDGQFSAGGMGLEKYEWKRGDRVLHVTFKGGKLHKKAKSGSWE